jgi:hypothetical protein
VNIIKVDSFRSEGTLVNKTDDMVRVVVDLTKREYMQLPSLFATAQNTKERRKTVRSAVQQAKVKTCPLCGSRKVEVFDSNNDHCLKCGEVFSGT